jgi:hypothetical protein
MINTRLLVTRSLRIVNQNCGIEVTYGPMLGFID